MAIAFYFKDSEGIIPLDSRTVAYDADFAGYVKRISYIVSAVFG